MQNTLGKISEKTRYFEKLKNKSVLTNILHSPIVRMQTQFCQPNG